MKFVDDVFKLYKEQLTSSEEGAFEVVFSLFADHDRKDLMRFISELNDDEMLQMVSFYVIEMLKHKIVKEGFAREATGETPLDPNVH